MFVDLRSEEGVTQTLGAKQIDCLDVRLMFHYLERHMCSNSWNDSVSLGLGVRVDTTVAKGFAVLEVLARAKRPMRLSALAEALALQKSNVHRLLRTLVELGYVEKDVETARYYASLKTWELGVSIISTNGLRRLAAPYLQRLHMQTQDTVLFAVPVGHEVLFLDRVAPARALRYTPLNGTRAAMAITAAGRVFLSGMSDPAPTIARGLRQELGDPSVKEVLATLADIRQRGVAIVDGALMAGTRAVSAPVYGPDGGVCAAITVSSMAERMSDDHLTEVIEAVLTIANEVSGAPAI